MDVKTNNLCSKCQRLRDSFPGETEMQVRALDVEE